MALATAFILFGVGTLAFVNYAYVHHILMPYHNYPEEVAVKLRRAVYYNNLIKQGYGTKEDAKNALKYYRQAVEVSEELGMDPFSDEVMGIKIQVGALMEHAQQFGKAAQVIEILRRDAMTWVNRYGDKPENRVKRTRLLAKCVAFSVKLGELYGHPNVHDRDAALERLVWAVETSLKESQRRASLGLSTEELELKEGMWLTPSEIGAALEDLGHRYEERDQHYLATPLFLQALSLNDKKGCHQVILMNNLATSLAQQNPRAAVEAQAYTLSSSISNTTQQTPTPQITTRESLIQNGITWAQKALDVAANIQPPERDDECDVGCAVALHNLGEFAEMQKDTMRARQKYKEAVSLSRAIGFEEGLEMSSARLRALKD
ncbi:hypothetical protein K431DRAFT_290071 [Polychaeton citri CBS 116435]|uniref:TPR-like protein n=1 Tax=Polychaeton citri CBS 116435 TaxID=1314669 RepID=A0A9P4QK39_9PEZI|nr:hypothetical protein K431DRAFT_290071 [Polychaeton citri CBS 116435]